MLFRSAGLASVLMGRGSRPNGGRSRTGRIGPTGFTGRGDGSGRCRVNGPVGLGTLGGLVRG